MRSILLLLLSLLAVHAAAQRKQLEKAAAYESAGMLMEAFDRYERIHTRKKQGSVEAHTGMKRTAQGLFDRMQADATGLYFADDLDGGERKRQEAAVYKQRMDRKGLDLRWDPLLEVRRRDAQRSAAGRLYERADAAFRADRFAEAEEFATRSAQLDPERKDAEYLLKLAQLEPLYRQGQRAMELELWRDAFRAFKRVTDRDAGYKDAWRLQAQAREKAEIVLAIVPIFNANLYLANPGLIRAGLIESHLAAAFKQSVLDTREPLIVLVDRDNMDQLLAEQQRQMSGVYDDRYVVEAGKLIGARYVVTGKILRYDEILRREIEVQMQLLDAESGRIHLSEIVRVNKDEIARGNTRSQLLDRAAKRMAARVAQFDPHKR